MAAASQLILPPGVDRPRQNLREEHAMRMVLKDRRLDGQRRRRGHTTVTRDPFDEIGTSGLRQYGGFIREEWLRGLQGKEGAYAYREMMDNSAIVGAILFAIKMLARRVEWRVENDTEDEFLESCMHDMSHTWGDFVSEALSMLGYGWAFHETVYKRRQGGDPLPEGAFDAAGFGADTQEDAEEVPPSSQYTDGRVGWRRLPIRAQETLMRWDFADYASLRAMEQVDWHGGAHTIPIQKALLFRTETTRQNPEGRSLLRNAWESFYYLKNIQNIEAMGIERDLAGIPMATPPPGVNLASPAYQKVREEVEEMVRSIRRDEDEGIVLPQADWKLELLTTGGSRQIDTDPIIRRYEQRITMSVLADFLVIGHESVGSYSMVDVKSEMFGMAVDAILDLICEVFNRYGFPRLLALNGIKKPEAAKLEHSSAGRIDLKKVGEFLADLSLAGAPIPWSKKLMEELFGEAALPVLFDEPVIDPAQPPANDPLWRPAWGDEKPQPDPNAPPPEEVTKADERPVEEGTVVNLAPVLADRAKLLSTQLERELQQVLGQLGQEAASAYLLVAEKAEVVAEKSDIPSPRQLERLVGKVMAQTHIAQWIREQLTPFLNNHAARVIGDTARVVGQELGQSPELPEGEVRRIEGRVGRHLKVRDIEPQVREAVMAAIVEGFRRGDNPIKTAQRIRHAVPAGRFVHAGPKWRAELIAREETANLQRQATLAAYASNPNIAHVEVSDGIYGPPRSDETCIHRHGEIVPTDEAQAVAPSLHPLCTVSYNPVVSVPLEHDPGEPELLAA